MANTAASAIRFWAFPATIIGLWVVVSAFSLGQLATVLPSLASPGSVQRPLQPAPQGCDFC